MLNVVCVMFFFCVVYTFARVVAAMTKKVNINLGTDPFSNNHSDTPIFNQMAAESMTVTRPALLYGLLVIDIINNHITDICHKFSHFL